MTNKGTAQDRRITAVADLVNNAFLDNYSQSRQYYIDAITALRPLGRTERWTTLIGKWVSAMDDQENPIDWVIVQYGVYAGYAAI